MRSVTATEGRRLWEQLLMRVINLQDTNAQQFMSWIIESVIRDQINVKMATDPVFAAEIGGRIQRLFDAEAAKENRRN